MHYGKISFLLKTLFAVLLAIGIHSNTAYAGENFTCQFVVSSEWDTGATASIVITNHSNQTAAWSQLTADFGTSNGVAVSNAWNAQSSGSPILTLSPYGWNSQLQAGASAEIGLQLSKPSGAVIEPPFLSGDCASEDGENTYPTASFSCENDQINFELSTETGYIATIEEFVICTSDYSNSNSDAVSVLWDTGDGSAPLTDTTFRHAYTDSGLVTITLTVSDDEFSETTTLDHIAIGNGLPPISILDCVAENVDITCAFSTEDPDNTNFTYILEWGDGNNSQTTSSATPLTHRYDEPGRYALRLTTYDGHHRHRADTEIVIHTNPSSNEPPVATILSCENRTRTYGQGPSGSSDFVVVCDYEASDPNNDTLTRTWDAGDGSELFEGYNPNFMYSAEGVYTITLTVSDGEFSSASSIDHFAEGNDSNGTASLNCTSQAETVTCDAHASNAEHKTLHMDWGDGNVEPLNNLDSPLTHAYVESGEYRLNLTATTSNTGIAAETTVAVAIDDRNLAPIARFSCENTEVNYETNTPDYGWIADIHQQVNCTNESSDPDGDELSYSWLAGDGSDAQTLTHFNHEYDESIVYTITLVASDGEASSSFSLEHLAIGNNREEDIPAAVECLYSITNTWGNNFQGSVRLNNISDENIEGWSVHWEYNDGSSIESLWGGELNTDNGYTVTPFSWNSLIAVNGSIEIGFNGNNGGNSPSIPSLGGSTCNP